MENKILNYINYLFKAAPKNQETEEMKEEIYQNTLDKYNDLINNGKSKEDAYLIAISNIGNIEELFDNNETLQEENVSSNNIDKEDNNVAINNEKKVEEPIKSRFNFLFVLSIIFYILAVIPEIISDDTPYEDTIGTGLMFLLIGVATILLVISQIKIIKTTKNKSHDTLKIAINVVGAITLITYFLVSFLTMAWYITWIIFIIGEIVKKIIKLCFEKEGDNRK